MRQLVFPCSACRLLTAEVVRLYCFSNQTGKIQARKVENITDKIVLLNSRRTRTQMDVQRVATVKLDVVNMIINQLTIWPPRAAFLKTCFTVQLFSSVDSPEGHHQRQVKRRSVIFTFEKFAIFCAFCASEAKKISHVCPTLDTLAQLFWSTRPVELKGFLILSIRKQGNNTVLEGH